MIFGNTITEKTLEQLFRRQLGMALNSRILFSWFNSELKGRVQPCGTEGEVTTCHTTITDGHRFKSWPLHFQSSSLLMFLGKHWRKVQVFGSLYPYGRPWWSSCPGSWLQPGPVLATAAIWGLSQQIQVVIHMLSLSLSLSHSLPLFLCFFFLSL